MASKPNKNIKLLPNIIDQQTVADSLSQHEKLNYWDTQYFTISYKYLKSVTPFMNI